MSNNEIFKSNSLDAFIDGKISLFQPIRGYRANTDSILLAAAVNAKKGQRVLELGCGIGTVLFSLMSRIKGLHVVGIEAQKKYARLAVRNAIQNNFEADIVTCDIAAIPNTYKNLEYDHVVLNPPFFVSKDSMRISNYDQDVAKREQTLSLMDWMDIAIKRCSVKGEVVLIHQAERLADITSIISDRLGDIKILPICSFSGEEAKRILVKGKKGSSSPLRILAPIVMHEGSRSRKPTKKHTDKVEGILRNGNGINWK